MSSYAMLATSVTGRQFVAPRYEHLDADEAAKFAAHKERVAAGARSQTAHFFYGLRQHLRIARGAIANRIGTEASVIEALETGNMGGLPGWTETVRVVQAYTALVNLDPRPALHALQLAYAHNQELLAARGFWGRQLDAWQSGTLGERLGKSFRLMSGLKWTAAMALPVLVAVMMLSSGPQALSLPGPLASMFGMHGRDAATAHVTRRDGFTWIEVVDPRSRRGDKLQHASR